MPTTGSPQTVFVGPINHLTVSATSAAIEMDDIDGVRENLLLWADTDAVIPDRVTQSMWVSMCREALSHGNEMLVVIDNQNSAQVVSMQLRRAANPAAG